MYNLKLTSKQTDLCQFYIFDLCNKWLHKEYTKDELSEFEEYDIFRYNIYKKYKRLNKTTWCLSNLTLDEVKFIRHEINYWMGGGFERDRYELISARTLIKKLDNLLDVQYQRDYKLKQLGIC